MSPIIAQPNIDKWFQKLIIKKIRKIHSLSIRQVPQPCIYGHVIDNGSLV